MKLVLTQRPALLQLCSICGHHIDGERVKETRIQIKMFGLKGRLCRCGQSIHGDIALTNGAQCIYCVDNKDHWTLLIPSNGLAGTK